jgi:hypothetical protein
MRCGVPVAAVAGFALDEIDVDTDPALEARWAKRAGIIAGDLGLLLPDRSRRFRRISRPPALSGSGLSAALRGRGRRRRLHGRAKCEFRLKSASIQHFPRGRTAAAAHL